MKKQGNLGKNMDSVIIIDEVLGLAERLSISELAT